jgi:hypothetical protein
VSVICGLASWLLGGCSSSSKELCPCPSGGAIIPVGNLGSPLVAASADSPCAIADTTSSPPDAAPSVVFINAPSGATCEVRLQLADGTTYGTSATFTAGGGCCSYTTFGTVGPLELLDGGARD